MPYAHNKGADQPAHPRSLIGAFVFHCLDSIIPLLSKSKISRLASLERWVCEWCCHYIAKIDIKIKLLIVFESTFQFILDTFESFVVAGLGCCLAGEELITWLSTQVVLYFVPSLYQLPIWAATWQNQQNESAPSKDSDQPGQMSRLIWVFAGRTVTLLVLSCRGSFDVADGKEIWMYQFLITAVSYLL